MELPPPPPPPLSTYDHNTKKRVFSGKSSSSSSFIEPDVIEIVTPGSRISKLHKQKQVFSGEVIDIDEDKSEVIVIDDKVSKSYKGKAIGSVSDGLSDFQAKGNSNHAGSDMDAFGTMNGVEFSRGFAFDLHTSTNPDGHPSYTSYDDEHFDFCYDDLPDVDEYTMLQTHFDNLDIPPGVEAPIPWLADHTQSNNKLASESSASLTKGQVQLNYVGPLHATMDPNKSFWLTEYAQSNLMPHFIDFPSLPTQLNAVHSSPFLVPHSSQGGKTLSASQHRGSCPNLPSQSQQLSGPSQSQQLSGPSLQTLEHSYINQYTGTKPPIGVEMHDIANSIENQHDTMMYTIPTPPMGTLNHPFGSEPHMSWWEEVSTYEMKPSSISQTEYPIFYGPFHYPHMLPEEEAYIPWVHHSAINHNSVATYGSPTSPPETISSMKKNVLSDDTLKKFQLFKQFDTVEDHSDHHFAHHGSSANQPSKDWAKRIQDEWKMLEEGLPDTIFVRVYESRMDLLRAVIVGAEGTPYHDGLFFFDVLFPSGYPNAPPNVYYHSGGLRLNPNLYACGKVCLSLLNTWTGDENEKWTPGVSTMLQVLVSIQGLILNSKPYFNEPGFERLSGWDKGQIASKKYNGNTFILSLKTMSYTMRRPPKHFEDFVVGFFCNRAHDILVACKVYNEGAQVGCLIKGGVQDGHKGYKKCPQQFKESLDGYVNMLVSDFANIGASDCEKFLCQPKTTTTNASNIPKPE